MKAPLRRPPWRLLLVRLTGFLLLWWVLTEGDLGKPWMAVAVASLATLTSLVVWPRALLRWQLRPWLHFVPWFLWRSALAGIDIASRALAPGLPLRPALRRYEVRLRSQPARAALAWTLSLFPGTASVRLEGPWLTVHLLNPELLSQEALGDLEQRLEALFATNPPDSDEPP